MEMGARDKPKQVRVSRSLVDFLKPLSDHAKEYNHLIYPAAPVSSTNEPSVGGADKSGEMADEVKNALVPGPEDTPGQTPVREDTPSVPTFLELGQVAAADDSPLVPKTLSPEGSSTKVSKGDILGVSGPPSSTSESAPANVSSPTSLAEPNGMQDGVQ